MARGGGGRRASPRSSCDGDWGVPRLDPALRRSLWLSSSWSRLEEDYRQMLEHRGTVNAPSAGSGGQEVLHSSVGGVALVEAHLGCSSPGSPLEDGEVSAGTGNGVSSPGAHGVCILEAGVCMGALPPSATHQVVLESWNVGKPARGDSCTPTVRQFALCYNMVPHGPDASLEVLPSLDNRDSRIGSCGVDDRTIAEVSAGSVGASMDGADYDSSSSGDRSNALLETDIGLAAPIVSEGVDLVLEASPRTPSAAGCVKDDCTKAAESTKGEGLLLAASLPTPPTDLSTISGSMTEGFNEADAASLLVAPTVVGVDAAVAAGEVPMNSHTSLQQVSHGGLHVPAQDRPFLSQDGHATTSNSYGGVWARPPVLGRVEDLQAGCATSQGAMGCDFPQPHLVSSSPQGARRLSPLPRSVQNSTNSSQ